MLAGMKNIVRKKQTNAILLFFAVMAGLTILSRIADSFMIPQVAVRPSEEMELKYPVEIEGRVGTEGKQAIYCQENLRIGNVFVEKNDVIEKGDLFFSVDMEDLTSKIKQLEQEIKKCDLQIADLENAYQEQVNLQNQSLIRAEEDYSAALNTTEKEVDTAYIEMEKAKSELERHDSLKPEEGSLENEKSDGKNVVRRNDSLETVEQAEVEKEEIEETDVFVEKSALEEWTQKREELEQKYYEKKKLYENAVASRDESLKAAARQIEDAGMGVNKNNSSALQQMEKESLKNLLQQLNDLREENGNVYSEFKGRILECSISTGSITTLEPVIILEDFSQPFQFEGFIGEKAAPFVEKGTECMLEIMQENVLLDGVKISEVAEGEDGMYRVTAKVDSDSVYQTGNAVLSFTESSKKYPKCIPLSALYSGNSGYYVIEIKEDETVLGAQLIAEYVPVTLIENNGEYAAVEGEISEYSKIVVSASKTIKEGDRVRIIEE